MSACYGENIRITIFGQSHAKAVGVVIDGLPAGFKLDTEKLAAFMARRAPGQGEHTTARKEADNVEFLSGIAGGVLCGAPLCAVIRNTDVRTADYAVLKDTPRPGHADYPARMKYGAAWDGAGGGQFSGRLTAPLCIAGAVCLQLLEAKGIRIGAHIERIGGVCDERFDPAAVSAADFDALHSDPLTVIDAAAGAAMLKKIEAVQALGDSIGGVIECAVIGLPAGIGGAMFGGMENRISSAVFAIPAVKAVEFGNGFASAQLFGSENNDAFVIKDGAVRTLTNNHGGVLGGITSGMPLIFRAAVKPTPSVSTPQQTVNLKEMKEVEICVGGRHDPCIVPRAVPCVEAAAAVAVYDALLSGQNNIWEDTAWKN